MDTLSTWVSVEWALIYFICQCRKIYWGWDSSLRDIRGFMFSDICHMASSSK